MSEPKKTIVINPDFLKLPMKGSRTRKNRHENNAIPKPIKIRSDKKSDSEKTIRRKALNYIRKQQEERYKRLMKGVDDNHNSIVPVNDGKTYADEFKSDFDDSLSFLQKLTDQSVQTAQVKNATLKHYSPPVNPNSLLFQPAILDKILNENISLEEPDVFRMDVNATRHPSTLSSTSTYPSSTYPSSTYPSIHLPKPLYGCLKGGNLPTYRTLKSKGGIIPSSSINEAQRADSSEARINSNIEQTISSSLSHGSSNLGQNQLQSRLPRLTPEQQRAELKQFLEKRKEEKQRVRQRQNIIRPGKKQKRTTTRTFRVGKSKHYPRVGVLIPNKTIRTQVLAKKQKIRETPLDDVRRHLIKNGLIRVGSSCPNDVLRQMYESSMMMCGEIQNHNPDNLLYNYLHNGM